MADLPAQRWLRDAQRSRGRGRSAGARPPAAKYPTSRRSRSTTRDAESVMSSLWSSSASACGAGTMPDLHRAMWNRPWTCNAMQHLLDDMSGKLGIATVITDEGMCPELLANALGNRGFDSTHVTENSHIPASRTTPYPARGEFYWSYGAFVALTAAARATSKLVIGGREYFLCRNGTRFDRRMPFPTSIRYPGVVGRRSDLGWVGTSMRPPIMALKPRCAANCSTRSGLSRPPRRFRCNLLLAEAHNEATALRHSPKYTAEPARSAKAAN